ncbi:MAG: energy transducer TonB [Bacteroidetes bacterium]|nr:energy transducer TonB [Bacteroidota bacterium]
MNNKKSTYQLFSPSGCLTQEAMLRYTNSGLSQTEMDQVNKHLDECELCQDAIDGIELKEDKEKLPETLAGLNRDLKVRLENVDSAKNPKTVYLQNRWLYLGAAASVIILFGLLFFLTNLIDSDNGHSTAQEVKTENRSVPPMPKADQHSNSSHDAIIDSEKAAVSEKDKEEANIVSQKSEPEKAEKEEASTRSDRKDKITPMKIQKLGDSVTERLLLEEMEDSDQEGIQSLTPAETDLATTEPVEYFLGEVVVYDHTFDDMTLDEVVGKRESYRVGKSRASRATKKSMAQGKNENAMRDEPQVATSQKSSPTLKRTENEHFFTLVDQMPQFPGGTDALMNYLSNHIQYPADAARMNIQGTVLISFIVEKDGNIASAKVIRGIGGGCDEEALRVIRSMPQWQPALKDNKPIRVLFNLPITFRMK